MVVQSTFSASTRFVSKKKNLTLYEKEIIAHNKIYRYGRGAWRRKERTRVVLFKDAVIS